MYQNRRPYQLNHIPDKLNYNNIKKNNKSYQQEYSKQLYFRNPSAKDYENFSLEEMILANGTLFEEELYQMPPIRNSFEEKFEKLEQQPTEIFEPIHYDIDNLNLIDIYLYHGIRFQDHLEKLESIFKNKAILAGNYQDDYYFSYSDNCNNGEYISLAGVSGSYDLVYKTFVMKNISLVISSACNAIRTIYLPFDEWQKISNRETKNRYSYANNEYQVKKEIPLDMIKAIGLPARYLRLTNQEHLIDNYLNDILELMQKYNIDLPIVDTSYYNNPLYLPKNHISNYITKRKSLRQVNNLQRSV